MADKQISQLTAGTIDNNADSFIFDDSDGYTYKLPYSDLAGVVLGQSLGAGTGISITTDSQSAIYKKIISVDSDSAPTQNSQKPVTSGGVHTALQGKQDTLTFDTTPTQNSSNPVTSGGVYAAIQGGGGGGGSYTRTLIYDNELARTQAESITPLQSLSNFDEIEFEYWEYWDESDYSLIPFSIRVSNYFIDTAPAVYTGEYVCHIMLQGTAGHYVDYQWSGVTLNKHGANTGDIKIIVVRIYGINY